MRKVSGLGTMFGHGQGSHRRQKEGAITEGDDGVLPGSAAHIVQQLQLEAQAESDLHTGSLADDPPSDALSGRHASAPGARPGSRVPRVGRAVRWRFSSSKRQCLQGESYGFLTFISLADAVGGGRATALHVRCSAGAISLLGRSRARIGARGRGARVGRLFAPFV